MTTSVFRSPLGPTFLCEWAGAAAGGISGKTNRADEAPAVIAPATKA